MQPNSTILPNALHEEIEARFGSPIQAVVEIAGGVINRAAQIALDGEAIFIKWSEHAPADLYDCEARGLEKLRATETLRVPKVLAVSPNFLALEYLAEGIVWDKAKWSQNFAENLAAMHRNLAPDNQFGGEPSYLGLIPLYNANTGNWLEFWRDCRMVPQIEMARAKGLQIGTLDLLIKLLDTLGEKLNHEIKPSLLHGDLWSGNYLAASAGAVLVDPAVFYGDREVELSYIELFGGFPPDFMSYYCAAWPFEAGYETRRPIYQLFYLLTHFNFFGEPYGQDVLRVCRRILQAS